MGAGLAFLGDSLDRLFKDARAIALNGSVHCEVESRFLKLCIWQIGVNGVVGGISMS